MRKSIWLVSAGLVALSTPAFAHQSDASAAAQPAADATAKAQAASEPDTGDIVVTATRRNEALSDVPLAVSAVTAESLKNTGANDIRALTQVSPSLLVSSTSSEAGAGGARIRGVGTVGDNPGLESSVAVFIDGVYRSRIGVGLTELGPVDRIEVLRGPQGTLFGRNASAGLVSIITAKPKFTPEVSGEVSVGNYNLRRGQLSVTGPISDTIAARVDGVWMKRDGFMHDVIGGRDVNGRDRWLLRGQLLFQPNSDVSFRLIADYSKRNEECCAASYLPARDAITNGSGGFTYGPSTIAAIERGLGGVINDDTFSRDVAITPGRDYAQQVKDYGLSGELTYDLGGVELTSITAYRYNDFVRGQDADFNNLDLLYRASDGNSANRFKTVTQELRFQGKAFGGKLDWLVGGYYANEKLRVKDNLSYGADYSRYANCLVSANFAASAAVPDAILSPTSNTCFNTAIAGGVRSALEGQYVAAAGNPALQAALAAQIGVLSAFARLPNDAFVPANFSAPPFTNSGFTNVSLANGGGLRTFAGVGQQDQFNQSSRNWAIFTHNIFEIAPGLNLTVGVRYTHETKKLAATLTDNNTLCALFSGVAALNSLQQLPCVIPSVPGGNWSGASSKSEGKLSGTVVLSWKPTPQLLTYASYSRGYKAGGFNLDRNSLPRNGATRNGAVLATASLDALQFEPEVNDALEAGVKYNGRGLDINVAVFRQLFDAFQLNTFNGISFEVANVSSCSASLGGADTDNSSATGACTNGKIKHGVKSSGVEFELFSRPMRDVTFNLGATYARTRYAQNLVTAAGTPISAQLFQLPGRQLSNASKLSLTGALGWTPPIGDNGIHGLFYVDARRMNTFNTGSNLDLEKIQKSFTVVNARVGLRGAEDSWAIEAWAQNLFNKNFYQVAFNTPLQGSGSTRGVEAGFYPVSTSLYSAFLGEPRTYGLTLRAKFAPRKAEPAPEPVVTPPPPPPPPATQTCSDGSVILATDACPPPPPPPPPPPAPERG